MDLKIHFMVLFFPKSTYNIQLVSVLEEDNGQSTRPEMPAEAPPSASGNLYFACKSSRSEIAAMPGEAPGRREILSQLRLRLHPPCNYRQARPAASA
jgi:hypothetical protein